MVWLYLESGIPTWNPESKTVLYSLGGGDWPLTFSLCTAGRLFPGSLWREGDLYTGYSLLTILTTPHHRVDWMTGWLRIPYRLATILRHRGQRSCVKHNFRTFQTKLIVSFSFRQHHPSSGNRSYPNNHFRRLLTTIRPDLKDDRMRLWSVTFVWTATVAPRKNSNQCQTQLICPLFSDCPENGVV